MGAVGPVGPVPTVAPVDALTARIRASNLVAPNRASASASRAIAKLKLPSPLLGRWPSKILGPVFGPVFALTLLAVVFVAVLLMRPSGAGAPASPPPAAAVTSSSSPSAAVTNAIPATGPQSTALFTSQPSGATVTVDSVVRGTTPLKIALPVGDHVADFTYNNLTRSISFDLAASTTASQHMEFASDEVVGTGRIDVSSDPTGAAVALDGDASGRTPVSLASVAVGRHTVTVGTGDSAVQRIVNVTSGATASIVVAVPASSSGRVAVSAPAAPAGVGGAGWITFDTSLDLRVVEKGEVIGTTGLSRVMLPAGRHDLVFSNDSLDFRTTLPVQVRPGTTTPVHIGVPNGSLFINASPWAEVTVDGRPLGTTPLANIAVPIGTHEIVWRHPQLGERQRTVTVGAAAPLRVGMDFSK